MEADNGLCMLRPDLCVRRSLMNVPFTISKGADLEAKFLKEATKAGLVSLFSWYISNTVSDMNFSCPWAGPCPKVSSQQDAPLLFQALCWNTKRTTLQTAKTFMTQLSVLKVQLKGHRSVGGMRASIYNSMPVEGVQLLVNFMKVTFFASLQHLFSLQSFFCSVFQLW